QTFAKIENEYHVEVGSPHEMKGARSLMPKLSNTFHTDAVARMLPEFATDQIDDASGLDHAEEGRSPHDDPVLFSADGQMRTRGGGEQSPTSIAARKKSKNSKSPTSVDEAEASPGSPPGKNSTSRRSWNVTMQERTHP
ncbi:unnamed protein product, partial [Amoebophrya sp. A25]